MLHESAQKWLEIPAEGQRLTGMEGLRAYAVLIVFLVHFFGAYARAAHGLDLGAVSLAELESPTLRLYYWLHRSHYGVDLFFFLSGFLILRIVAREAFRYPRFLQQRIVRIYPAFLVSTCLIAVAFYGPERFLTWGFLGNLLFLNGLPELGVAPVNVATWSLFFEFAFYITFPAIVLFRTRSGVTTWHVVGFAAVAFAALCFLPSWYFRFLMFFGGALLASLSRAQIDRLVAWTSDATVLPLYLASTAYFSFSPGFRTFIPVYAAACFLLVLRVLYGNGPLGRLFSAEPLRWIGNTSYSFYLIHGFAIAVVFHFARLWFPAEVLGEPLALAALLAACLAAGMALAVPLFVGLERPYFVWRRARGGTATTRKRVDAQRGSPIRPLPRPQQEHSEVTL
jgi:peptidoglycan/LPS O-acetylase OafA/YrhL